MNDLQNAVIKYNHHAPITEASVEVKSQIQIELCHRHLPKLEASGVIEYDGTRRRMKPTAQFDELQPHLSTIIDADPALEPPVRL